MLRIRGDQRIVARRQFLPVFTAVAHDGAVAACDCVRNALPSIHQEREGGMGGAKGHRKLTKSKHDSILVFVMMHG